MMRLVSICFLCRTTYMYFPLENCTSLIIYYSSKVLGGCTARFKMVSHN